MVKEFKFIIDDEKDSINVVTDNGSETYAEDLYVLIGYLYTCLRNGGFTYEEIAKTCENMLNNFVEKEDTQEE